MLGWVVSERYLVNLNERVKFAYAWLMSQVLWITILSCTEKDVVWAVAIVRFEELS